MYLSGNTAETDVYLVATASLGMRDNFRATGGLLYQKPNSSASGSNLTAMMGVEFGTRGSTTVGFDYVFNDIAAGNMLGAIVRQPITRDLTGQFGLGMGSGTRYFIGMTMKFGGK